MKNSKFIFIVLISFALGSYIFVKDINTLDNKENTKTHIGYFVNVFKSPVEYSCLNQLYPIPESGEFRCSAFPIAFYMDSVKLGEIRSIHSDGYVFPQDIIVLDSSDKLPKSSFVLSLR